MLLNSPLTIRSFCVKADRHITLLVVQLLVTASSRSYKTAVKSLDVTARVRDVLTLISNIKYTASSQVQLVPLLLLHQFPYQFMLLVSHLLISALCHH